MGQPGHGSHHDAGQKLHGDHVPMIESVGDRRQHLEQAERAAIVAQRSNQDGACSQTTATGEIDTRVGFGVVAITLLAAQILRLLFARSPGGGDGA